MPDEVLSFYEALASHYHLIFDDWDRAIERQARILGTLLAAELGSHPLRILDCACGIGTQAIGLARLGHLVLGSDLSPAEVHRSQAEAQRRSLDIPFRVSDMTSLAEIPERDFDAVIAVDNALPHLSPVALQQAAHAIAAKLRPGGVFLASIRDYDAIQPRHSAIQPPAFFGAPGNRRIVHQLWDWISDTHYLVHLYLTLENGVAWTSHHFVSQYRLLLRDELTLALRAAGFDSVRWSMPTASGFYQPIVIATRPR